MMRNVKSQPTTMLQMKLWKPERPVIGAGGAVIARAGLRAMLGAAEAVSHAAALGEITPAQAQEELCATIVAMVERARASTSATQ